MAISQERYVKIRSTNIGDPAVSNRELGGLIFTKGAGWKNSDPWDSDTMIKCYSAEQLKSDFRSDSDEMVAAIRYFSYVSPSGSAPSSLTFVKMGEGENPVDAIQRIDTDTNNFGSFEFLDLGDYTCKQFRDVAIYNAGKNYKYLFSVTCLDSATAVTATDSTKMDAVKTVAFKDYLTAGEVEEEFKTDDGIKGTVVINGADKHSALMPMAISASIDYDGVNTVPSFMFKQFPGESPTVKDDTTADAFDSKNINYYGLVQVNGQRKAFFQTGVNSDGEDTAVYFNELWLKSTISTAVMNMFLGVEKIPANDDGALMVYGILMSAAEQGVRNGMILKGKALTEEQKAKIYSLTKDSEAWFTVQNSGYIGSVEVRQDNDTKKYIAYYKLIYSKGDSIRKVEGSDILV